MRVFKSNTKNNLYFLYRMLNPLFDPLKFYYGVIGYASFMKDIITYKKMDSSAKIVNINLFPALHDKTLHKDQEFDAHYFYQQLWAFEHILKRKPKVHVDVGSTYSMSGYISKITKSVFVDIRPIKTSLKNLSVVNADILNLPFKDSSVESLSCLHVVEHIGLGRYGDAINPNGTKEACEELARVLSKNGYLYFSTPIGKDKICFNAHRIHRPQQLLKYFKNLKLLSFSVVDDDGNFHEGVHYKDYVNLNYGLGMFLFKKR